MTGETLTPKACRLANPSRHGPTRAGVRDGRVEAREVRRVERAGLPARPRARAGARRGPRGPLARRVGSRLGRRVRRRLRARGEPVATPGGARARHARRERRAQRREGARARALPRTPRHRRRQSRRRRCRRRRRRAQYSRGRCGEGGRGRGRCVAEAERGAHAQQRRERARAVFGRLRASARSGLPPRLHSEEKRVEQHTRGPHSFPAIQSVNRTARPTTPGHRGAPQPHLQRLHVSAVRLPYRRELRLRPAMHGE